MKTAEPDERSRHSDEREEPAGRRDRRQRRDPVGDEVRDRVRDREHQVAHARIRVRPRRSRRCAALAAGARTATSTPLLISPAVLSMPPAE